MFIGIIETTGQLVSRDQNHYRISCPWADELTLGESVACNGVCLTVIRINTESFTVEIITESRKLTTFADIQIGDQVNLERSAIIGARNSGHHVTGHIDITSQLLRLEKIKDYWCLRFSLKDEHRKLVVYKGSIAINGISLTISGVSGLKSKKNWFEVSVIDHTWRHTNLSHLQADDFANLEFDIVGKYQENQDNFDIWNQQKKKLGEQGVPRYFREREVFFMKLGKNVGFEQDGKGCDFSRPVVVVKKFNRYFFWGIPLTSKKPKSLNPYYFYVGKIKQKDNWAVLSQGRAFASERLNDRIGSVSKKINEELSISIKKILF